MMSKLLFELFHNLLSSPKDVNRTGHTHTSYVPTEGFDIYFSRKDKILDELRLSLQKYSYWVETLRESFIQYEKLPDDSDNHFRSCLFESVNVRSNYSDSCQYNIFGFPCGDICLRHVAVDWDLGGWCNCGGVGFHFNPYNLLLRPPYCCTPPSVKVRDLEPRIVHSAVKQKDYGMKKRHIEEKKLKNCQARVQIMSPMSSPNSYF